MSGRRLSPSIDALALIALGSALTLVGLRFSARTVQPLAAQAPPAGAQNRPANQPPPQPHVTYTNYEPVNGKGGEEVSGPYQVVKGWGVNDGWNINAEGIYVESPDRIIAVGRGTRKIPWGTFWGPAAMRGLGARQPEEDQKRGTLIAVYNREGKAVEVLDRWREILPDVQQIEANPYDPEHHIWIATDDSLVELTRDLKAHVKTIDVKAVTQPVDPKKPRFVVEHFAWGANGDLYAAGGYNLVRFDKNGKFVAMYGKPGNGSGELGIIREGLHGDGIHGVAIDPARNRMYVDDRVNSRIVVFDLNGKYLDTWPNFPGPYCVRLTKDGQFLWVADGYTQKIGKYEAMTGKLVPGSTWGTMGIAPGAIWGFHWFTTDVEGNLYIGEDMAYRIQKFVPRRDGVATQLVGQLMD